jgi:hypothetical protein
MVAWSVELGAKAKGELLIHRTVKKDSMATAFCATLSHKLLQHVDRAAEKLRFRRVWKAEGYRRERSRRESRTGVSKAVV